MLIAWTTNAAGLVAATGDFGELIKLLIILAVVAFSAIGQVLQKMAQNAREKRDKLKAEAEAARMRASVGKPPATQAQMLRRPAAQSAPGATPARRPIATRPSPSTLRRDVASASTASGAPPAPPLPPVRPQQRVGRGAPSLSGDRAKRSPADGSKPRTASAVTPAPESPRASRRSDHGSLSSVERRHLEPAMPHLLSQIEQRAHRTPGRVVEDAVPQAAEGEISARRRDGIRGQLRRSPQEWRQAVVMAEILGPPVSLRGDDRIG